jgi:putative flavoprotein involved in K+ transport
MTVRECPRVEVVVIGAGHAGLAMSWCLTGRGIDHVVLERGQIANAWRQDRWDSLRLLTPNWQCRLPGYRYSGPDPDGFMGREEVVDFIAGYAANFRAPVRTGVTVTAVSAFGGGYRVNTDYGPWECRALVIATGAFAVPRVPAIADRLPATIEQYTAGNYRSPGQLCDGHVLVVGGSATGVQLADEIRRSGRQVTLAVGEHVRLPRCYRGRDIQWWLDAIGVLDERHDQVDDLHRARRVPSPQLSGAATLDLNALQSRGVRVVGRLAGFSDGRAQFSGGLRNHCALADLKMNRLFRRIDQWAQAHGMDNNLPPPEDFPATRVDDNPLLTLDLHRQGLRSLVWATGFRPDYSWLRVPVLDRKGNLRHHGGVVAPGLYALGLPFMRRRSSSFIHGTANDARELCAHLVDYLESEYRRSNFAVSMA